MAAPAEEPRVSGNEERSAAPDFGAAIRSLLDAKGHAVDHARRALEILEGALDRGELARTPRLDGMIADLRAALETDERNRVGGKSAEAARLILRAIVRELDRLSSSAHPGVGGPRA